MPVKRLADLHLEVGELLYHLQRASIGGSSIFSSEKNRDWFETMLIRAQYKVRAAEYHCENLEALDKKLHAEAAAKAASMSTGAGDIGTSRQSFTQHVPPIAHELDAFLTAARSAIDHLANCMGRHIQGMTNATIGTLLAMDLADPATPFAPHLSKWNDWIDYIRDYRDQHVHYRVLYGKHGYEIIRDGKSVSFDVIPFVVPEKLKPDEPWTKLRILDPANNDDPEGVVRLETKSASSSQARIEFRAAPGYLTGRDFCEQNLRKLAQFSSETVVSIKTNGFRSMKLPHRGGTTK